jgi:hypothetical protein
MGSKALLHCSCGSVRAMPSGVVRSRLRRSRRSGCSAPTTPWSWLMMLPMGFEPRTFRGFHTKANALAHSATAAWGGQSGRQNYTQFIPGRPLLRRAKNTPAQPSCCSIRRCIMAGTMQRCSPPVLSRTRDCPAIAVTQLQAGLQEAEQDL